MVFVEQLELQGVEEALGEAVVVGVADGSHRAEQAGGAEAGPERLVCRGRRLLAVAVEAGLATALAIMIQGAGRCVERGTPGTLTIPAEHELGFGNQ